jgi:serine O-acetyltransferase
MESAPHSASSGRSFELLRRDFARYFSPDLTRGYLRGEMTFFQKVQTFLDTPGLHAVITYRFASWIHRRVKLRLVRYPLLLIHYVMQKLCIICWGIYIHEGARIGPGLYIGHFGGIIIGPVTIGSDCNINHQVTIGVRADDGSALPVIGDRVWIGNGSVIYGEVHIGDGVTIGPLTVVSRSLPPRVLVSGNPMRVIAKDYDNSAAIYGGGGTTASVEPASEITS